MCLRPPPPLTPLRYLHITTTMHHHPSLGSRTLASDVVVHPDSRHLSLALTLTLSFVLVPVPFATSLQNSDRRTSTPNIVPPSAHACLCVDVYMIASACAPGVHVCTPDPCVRIMWYVVSSVHCHDRYESSPSDVRLSKSYTAYIAITMIGAASLDFHDLLTWLLCLCG